MNASRRALLVVSAIATLVPHPAGATPSPEVGLLLASMNDARASQRLQPLALDRSLSRIAYAHAVDMERRKYFSHDTPDGTSPFARMSVTHVRFAFAAENIAIDQSARDVFNDFWDSTQHRSNMLCDRYQKVGIAAVRTPSGTIVVEDFSD